MQNFIPPKYRSWMTNVALALAAGYFAQAYLLSFWRYPRVDTLLLFVLETVVVILFLTRNHARTGSVRFFDWFAAAGGTLMPLFFRPVLPAEIVEDGFIARIVQIIGTLICIAAASSLNTSFGLVPALRGIKTSGLYRVIRHPMYMGYALAWSGYMLSNVSAINIAVWILSIFFILWRLRNEERFLSVENAYRTYIQHVRWKLVPHVY